MGVGADAGAPKGVLDDAGAVGDSERGGKADGRARAPEVLAPAELESFLAGVMGCCCVVAQYSGTSTPEPPCCARFLRARHVCGKKENFEPLRISF